MINSIKYILARKNISQEQIRPTKSKKQYVSRWILGERKIPKDVVLLWSNYLNVPEKYIINKRGYSKQLTESEVLELDEYLLNKCLEERSKLKHCTDLELEPIPEIERATREVQLTKNILRLKKEINSDIYMTNYNSEHESLEQVLDEQESNLDFYNNVLRIHKHRKIWNEEWWCILKALSYFIDDLEGNLKFNCETNSLEYAIFDLLKKNRERKMQNNANKTKELEDIFGEQFWETNNF